MAQKPLTNYVYVDTSEFRFRQFDLNAKAFATLLDLAREGHAKLLTTSIGVEECKRRIREGVFDAVTEWKKLKLSAMWALKRFPEYEVVLTPPKATVLLARLMSEYEEYLKDAHAEAVDVSYASVGDVTSQYLTQAAPFGSGDKRLEFPDAIVLSALLGWCKRHKRASYVVTRDQGFRSACDGKKYLHPLSDLSEFLDLISRHEKVVSDRATQAFIARSAEIVELVADKFNDLGFYLSDADGDVNATSVTNVELGDPRIIFIEDERTYFEVDCQVTFTAEISYQDPSTGAWDWEDEVQIMMDTKERTVDRTVSIVADILFEYASMSDLGDPDTIAITIDSLNSGESVRVKFDPW